MPLPSRKAAAGFAGYALAFGRNGSVRKRPLTREPERIGFYGGAFKVPSAANRAFNEAVADKMMAHGCTAYLSVAPADAAEGLWHFDMLHERGIACGLDTNFVDYTPTVTYPGSYDADALAALASLGTHPAVSHVYAGHEINEYETHTMRTQRHALMRQHYTKPVRSYWAGLDGATSEYAFSAAEPDEVIHFHSGLTTEFGDFEGTVVARFLERRDRVWVYSGRHHEIVTHFTVDAAYADPAMLAYAAMRVTALGADEVYFRPDSGGSIAGPTEAMYDAVALAVGITP